jgi:uncharacterized phage protein (TIGR02218 family)
MRPIQAALAAHLDGAVTTLARSWRLTRRDGVVMGFTDHDRDLVFDGVTHRARAGLDASEAKAELGFAVASIDVAGALSHDSITEADIQRGLYDGAEVEVFLVNWADPAMRQRLDVLSIGEIRRGDLAFIAELRNAGHRFDEERGRLYTLRCDADLGDARCQKAITSASGQVVTTNGRGVLTASGLAAHASGWFRGGRLSFTSGENAGAAIEVRRHERLGAEAELALWLDAPRPIAPGDAFTITPGCDKSFATCRGKFGNGANFQGFPHTPGTDYLLQVAGNREGQLFDGGSLFR